MEHPGFFERAGPFPLRAVAETGGAKLADGADPDLLIKDVRPLDSAGQGDLSFLDNRKYLPLFAETGGKRLPCRPEIRSAMRRRHGLPGHARALSRFCQGHALFYPDALRPKAGDGMRTSRRGGPRSTRPPHRARRHRRAGRRRSDPRHASEAAPPLPPAASSATACMSGGIAISVRTPR